MMAAAILHDGVTVLHGCPRIADVNSMAHILESLGVKIQWQGHSLKMDCGRINEKCISREEAVSMRSSIILLGSLLARRGEVQIARPGGCTIGERPIDLHLMVLQKMGASITCRDEMLLAVCRKRLLGTEVDFPISSVGATENALIAAVRARGVSRLTNCAVEPEITHLCHFLQGMGAEIGGIGTRRIWVRGVGALRDSEYTVPPDRIAAGTFLYAAAITRGEIVIANPPFDEMQSVLRVYEKMGGQWESIGGKLRANALQVEKPVCGIETSCYPGFPTDMQSICMAVMTTLPGESTICERIFEDRFKVVSELKAMGGDIRLEGRKAIINGGMPLTGGQVKARELRGGAALVLAGLAASGKTIIRNSHFIERGYEDLGENISSLGGRIQIRNR